MEKTKTLDEIIKYLEELKQYKEISKKERLTIKDPTGNNRFTLKNICVIDEQGKVDDVHSCEEYCSHQNAGCDECPIQHAFNKLAEYENIESTDT